MKAVDPALFLMMLLLTGCERPSDDYYRLLQETGATPQELNQGIVIYTEFYKRLKEEIDAGNVTVEDLVEAIKEIQQSKPGSIVTHPSRSTASAYRRSHAHGQRPGEP